MLLIAIALFAAGLVVSLLGFKLFRILLPVLGLVAGTVVGFVGFQGVFGKGAVSTTVAIFVALVTGLMLALLSFLFFEIALTVYTAILGAVALSYLGVALGLGDNGFVIFLLSVTGFVLGLSIAGGSAFSAKFVIAVTSLAGVALMLAGVFLIVGNLTAAQLNDEGVIRSVVDVVDQSFLWLFVWIGSSLIAIQAQARLLLMEVLDNDYQYKTKTTSK